MTTIKAIPLVSIVDDYHQSGVLEKEIDVDQPHNFVYQARRVMFNTYIRLSMV